MSGLIYNVEPTTQPVTLQEALLFLKQNAGTSDDALITDLIIMATKEVEVITEHQLQDATSTQFFDGWPGGSYGAGYGGYYNRFITLMRPPLQSVVSVKFIDFDDVEQTIDASNYTVKINNEARGLIQFDVDFTLPILSRNVVDSVFIEFVSGYQSWPGQNGIPVSLKTAIKYFVNEIYQHRLYQQEANITGFLMKNEFAMKLLRAYMVRSPDSIGLGGLIPNVVT